MDSTGIKAAALCITDDKKNDRITFDCQGGQPPLLLENEL